MSYVKESLLNYVIIRVVMIIEPYGTAIASVFGGREPIIDRIACRMLRAGFKLPIMMTMKGRSDGFYPKR